jgi:hypothetical protein
MQPILPFVYLRELSWPGNPYSTPVPVPISSFNLQLRYRTLPANFILELQLLLQLLLYQQN